MRHQPSRFIAVLLTILFLTGASVGRAEDREPDEAKKKKKPAKTVPVVPPAEASKPTPPPEGAMPTPVADPAAQAPATTPAPEATPAPTATPEMAAASPTGEKSNLLGPVAIGPAITVLGFPTPFRIGLEAKYLDWAGLSFDYGFFPSLTFSNIKLKFNSWRVTARAHPFQGSFFLGVGYGKQNFDAELTNTISGTTVNYALNVNTSLILPHLGWRWMADSGFFFGMELGVQLAASSTATFTSDAPAAIQATPEYTTAKTDIEDKGKTFGQTTLPHFALVQLGWMF